MTKKIIFISYFFFPYKQVGANRVRFWVQNLNNYHPEYEAIVITATPFSSKEQIAKKQYFVPISGLRLTGLLIRDMGVRWLEPLKKFFRQHSLGEVHSVVISGGPFMHFGIARFLKKIFGCKVVLDFRDPFADNPRFKNSAIKIRIKKYFERRFVRMADLITSTNEACLQQISGYGQGSKFHVVANGFDSDTLDMARNKSKTKQKGEVFTIGHSGRFYPNASPLQTLEALKVKVEEGLKVKMLHLGPPLNHEKTTKKLEFLEEKGVVDYSVVMENLLSCDAGILYIEGLLFEVSTKVYDYIAAEIPIIIVSNGIFHSGNMEGITFDYPEVIWCKNDKYDIGKAIGDLYARRPKVSYPSKEKYSRKHGLNRLLNLIEQ